MKKSILTLVKFLKKEMSIDTMIYQFKRGSSLIKHSRYCRVIFWASGAHSILHPSIGQVSLIKSFCVYSPIRIDNYPFFEHFKNWTPTKHILLLYQLSKSFRTLITFVIDKISQKRTLNCQRKGTKRAEKNHTKDT